MDVSITFDRTAVLFDHDHFISGMYEAEKMAEIMKNKDVRADILQVSAGSPFSGIGFCERCKEKGCLPADDPDGHLDFQRRHKAVISYSRLSAEGLVGRWRGCCMVTGLCSDCCGGGAEEAGDG